MLNYTLTLPFYPGGCDPCQKRLLDYLLNESHYDVDIRPVTNYSQPVNVTMEATVFQMMELVGCPGAIVSKNYKKVIALL